MRPCIQLLIPAALFLSTLTGRPLRGEAPVNAMREGAGGDQITCPCCHHVCKLAVEKTKEKQSCWKVVREPICIPRIRFPWQKCDTPLCARIKYVNVLKEHEYECAVCHYQWSPECACCGENASRRGSCPPPSDGLSERQGNPQALQPTRPPTPAAAGRPARRFPPTPATPVVRRGLSDRGPSDR